MLNSTPIDTTTSEMEMDTFDVFSQLDDLVIEGSEGKPNASEKVDTDFEPVTHELEIDEDDFDSLDGDLFDENGFEVDELEDSPDIEDDVFDIEMKEMARFGKEFDHLPEDTEFNIAGTTFTKQQLASLANQNETVTTAYQAIEHVISQDKMLSEAMKVKAFGMQTEISKTKQAVEARLNDPYTPDIEKAALYSQLQNLNAREAQVNADVQQFGQQQAQRIMQAKQARLDMVSAELDKRYSSQAITDVVTYAQAQGINEHQMMDNASVEYFEALMKAKKYDDLMTKSKGKVNQVEQAKTATATAKKSRKQKPTAKRSQVEKAFDEGNMLDTFNYLED